MSPVRLLVASAVFGSWAFSTLAAPLTPEDAAGHIEEITTVCGVVASAKYEVNEVAADVGGPGEGVSECRVHRSRLWGEPREIRNPRDLASGQAHLCDGED
jgi:hypothetical protein